MRKVLVSLLLIVISAYAGYMFGVNKVEWEWKNYQPNITVSNKQPPNPNMEVDFSVLWTVMDKLEANYYDKTVIDPQEMLNGAVTGLVASLGDPYTTYLPPAQNEDFKETLAGQFEGIGAELGVEENKIIVVAPLDGSPAKEAGLRAGDQILKVDDEVILGWTINQAVDKIRGPKGSNVLLTVVHKTEENQREVAITRGTINVDSVFMWTKKANEIDEINAQDLPEAMRDQQIAYIRLSQFGDRTNQEWLQMVNDLNLKINMGEDIKGLVLDLRNNPGGYLTDAVFISSDFIPVGETVVMQEDSKKNRIELKTERKGLLPDIPLVILVNRGSASASEIVSGAMRDHERAILVGEKSFGKGTIQTAEDLGGGAGLHITIAKWLTPNGTWVHKEGLTPDVEVAIDEKDPSHDAQLEKAIEELLQS